jgi:sugar transferase (PEP-CTERM/EpsH1 system associated)
MTRNDAAKTILLLTPQFPYPPHQGTTLRNYNLIAGLARHHQVHLLSFGDPAASRGTPVDDLCHTVQVFSPPERSTLQRLKGLAFSRLPDMAQRLPSADFAGALDATLQRLDPDVVEVEGIELAQYLFQVTGRRESVGRPLVVFDDHNAEYVLQQRAFETDVRQPRRWIGAAYSFVQWQRLKGYERRACRAAGRVVAVSEPDAGAIRRIAPEVEPVVVPNGVDMEYYSAAVPRLDATQGPGAQDLVFTAKMDFRPNVDAVLWFAQSVLPQVRSESPQTRFWVVGKDPHPRLAPLAANPGVVITGWVKDVRPYIAGASLYVIPLRIGGGTRLKVLEAMAMGKAIVSTTLGCEGFDLTPGQELVVAGTPDEFAAAVLALLRDPARRESMGLAARQYASSRYDWRMIVPLLERVYET